MFCETTSFNSLVCFPLSQCLPRNGLILIAWGVGVGSSFKYQLEVCLFSNPVPRPSSNLVRNPWRFACSCFSFTTRRENSNNNSLRKTHDMTRQRKKQRQNLNLLNDRFNSILLFCRDSLVSSL